MASEPMTELSELTDEELVSMRDRDGRIFLVLLRRYQRLAALFAGQAARNSADAEDFTQEGLLALCAAIVAFSPENGANFRTFAAVCIRRRICSAATAVSAAAKPIGGSLDDPEIPAEELLADETASPELMLLAKEQTAELYDLMAHILSRQEREIFCLRLSGFSYREIAERLQISQKSVENALLRARRKLRVVRGGGDSPRKA